MGALKGVPQSPLLASEDTCCTVINAQSVSPRLLVLVSFKVGLVVWPVSKEEKMDEMP